MLSSYRVVTSCNWSGQLQTTVVCLWTESKLPAVKSWIIACNYTVPLTFGLSDLAHSPAVLTLFYNWEVGGFLILIQQKLSFYFAFSLLSMELGDCHSKRFHNIITLPISTMYMCLVIFTCFTAIIGIFHRLWYISSFYIHLLYYTIVILYECVQRHVHVYRWLLVHNISSIFIRYRFKNFCQVWCCGFKVLENFLHANKRLEL